MIEKRKEKSMAIKSEDLTIIGEYVQQHLPEWLQAVHYRHLSIGKDMELRERTIRVEEELKSQRELMQQGFSLVEKRFEQVDKRLEQVDKRFEQVERSFTRMTVIITTGFAMVSVLITVFKFLK